MYLKPSSFSIVIELNIETLKKTGTAETGSGDPHSWFIGFIGDEEPRYAVSVVLEAGAGELGAAVAIGQGMLASAMAADS